MHASRVLEVEHGTFTPLVFTTTGGKIYRQHETDKKRMHASSVLEVEHGTFTPLVFTTTSGMADECKRFHSRLVELIALKKGEEYSTTISWIRTNVSFAILRSDVRAHQGDIAVHRSCPF